MKQILNIITPLHKKTQRDYVGRMLDNKVECMNVARRYGKEYWDGDRRYGYGGYRYDGRWEVVARQLIDLYTLPDDAKILDVGCGKGYLLYEFKKLLPKSTVRGFDISGYAIENSKEEVRDSLFHHSASDTYPFSDKEYDIVISMTTLHNLCLYELKKALIEIERVGKNKYIVIESYRDEKELFNLQCWALTCSVFLKPEEWIWLFRDFGYSGDFEFIYFE